MWKRGCCVSFLVFCLSCGGDDTPVVGQEECRGLETAVWRLYPNGGPTYTLSLGYTLDSLDASNFPDRVFYYSGSCWGRESSVQYHLGPSDSTLSAYIIQGDWHLTFAGKVRRNFFIRDRHGIFASGSFETDDPSIIESGTFELIEYKNLGP